MEPPIVDVSLPLSTIFQMTAALNAAILGAVAICHSLVRPAPALRIAGIGLLIVATAMVMISFEQAGHLDSVPEWTLFESLLTLLAGPVLIVLVLTIFLRTIPLSVLFVPPAVYFSTVWLIFGLDHYLLSIKSIVPIQFAYTAIAWAIVTKLRRTTEATRSLPKQFNAALYVLVAMTVIHLAQFVRLVGPDWEVTQNIVPVVAGVLFLLLTVAALRGSNLATVLHNIRGQSRNAEQGAAIMLDLANLIEHRQLQLDQDLRLADVASALDIAPNELSRAINDSIGINFSAYISRARIKFSRQLLRDQNERRTSIEAIGMMSGFRSRSVFYRAFSVETGTSPAQYRKKHFST